VVVVIACFIVPFLPFVKNPTAINLANPAAAPSTQYWFGTDQLGRDILSRVIVATGLDFGMALAAVLLLALFFRPAERAPASVAAA
jgi:ABC-type dipeptide/oligopeptide/nickel transport system permease subunit